MRRTNTSVKILAPESSERDNLVLDCSHLFSSALHPLLPDRQGDSTRDVSASAMIWPHFALLDANNDTILDTHELGLPSRPLYDMAHNFLASAVLKNRWMINGRIVLVERLTGKDGINTATRREDEVNGKTGRGHSASDPTAGTYYMDADNDDDDDDDDDNGANGIVAVKGDATSLDDATGTDSNSQGEGKRVNSISPGLTFMELRTYTALLLPEELCFAMERLDARLSGWLWDDCQEEFVVASMRDSRGGCHSEDSERTLSNTPEANIEASRSVSLTTKPPPSHTALEAVALLESSTTSSRGLTLFLFLARLSPSILLSLSIAIFGIIFEAACRQLCLFEMPSQFLFASPSCQSKQQQRQQQQKGDTGEYLTPGEEEMTDADAKPATILSSPSPEELLIRATTRAYRDSFVLKIVCLHFCSNFSSLFFIAFVEMDIEKLRYQLATMLVIRQVILICLFRFRGIEERNI